MENNGRDQFVSKIGFILACVGSAVGMANIWLFPYRLGQLGGAAFLIPYLLFVFLIGYTGVVEEMAFGRAMKTGPLGAFHKATLQKGSNAGSLIGWIPVLPFKNQQCMSMLYPEQSDALFTFYIVQ